MRASLTFIIIDLLSIVLVVLSNETSTVTQTPPTLAGNSTTIPLSHKLVDFTHFKAIFNKHYATLTEELSRHKLFISRVISTCISQAKYQLGLTSFYANINHLSDRTSQERKRLVLKSLRHSDPETVRDEKPKIKKGALGRNRQFNQGDELNFNHIKIVFESADGNDVPITKTTRDRRKLKKRRKPKEDEVYYDLRKNNCFNEVRDQGECGSCYAFTNAAISEYLYCRSTGKKIKFSEQYVVDCSGLVDMDGCEGGHFAGMVEFIRNFGLELDKWYPYKQELTSCPLVSQNNQTRLLRPPSSAGYIRMKHVPRRSVVPMEYWEDYLEAGIPLDVTITTDIDKFSEYGGGVDMGGKATDEYHSMTLIGSGHENGLDYWLLRNSFGPDWGVEGHYKLAKNSDEVEIDDRGETFSAFTDFIDLRDVYQFNKKYDRNLIVGKQ